MGDKAEPRPTRKPPGPALPPPLQKPPGPALPPPLQKPPGPALPPPLQKSLGPALPPPLQKSPGPALPPPLQKPPGPALPPPLQKSPGPALPPPLQKPPGPALPPPPGQQKLKSKQARIERQKERAISLNNSSDWFGIPRDSPPELNLEDKFESTMSLSDSKKEQVRKNSPTFTGFRELRVKDTLVILALWSLRLFIPWVESWHEFNLHLLIDPSHWAQRETYFASQETIAFLGKCLICLAVSILVDFMIFRYPIYLMILLLYIFAPIIGMAIIEIISARGYDRPYYYEMWHISVVMMMWAMSVPFITFPLQFSCIFNQEQSMSRLAHYNWTAIFVFIETLSACTAYWVIPPNCPTSSDTLFAVWVIIGVLILVMQIEVLSFMRWAKPLIKNFNSPMCKKKRTLAIMSSDKAENSTESTVVTKPNMTGAPKLENGPPNKLKMRKLMWFLAMLVPVTFTTVVFEILKRVRPEEDWDKHDSITGTSMLISGQCLGVLAVVAVLFPNRKWMKKLHNIAILRPDVLALGIPLFINTAALVVILARYLVLSGLNEGDVILGPLPDNKVSVIEFYNVEFRNRSICVHSEYFSPLKVPPRQRASTVLRDPGGASITFNVTLDPRTTPPIPTHMEFTYTEGIWITYLVTLPPNELADSDIKALYSELLVVQVKGTDYIRPEEEPQVVFINTYVSEGVRNWYFNVTSSGEIDTFETTHKAVAEIKRYPPGELIITYWTDFTDLQKSQPPKTIQLLVENYCVYTVLLCLSNTAKNISNKYEPVPRMLQKHKTMEIAGPNSKRLPAKEELDKDWAIILGMTLAGMAKAGVYVGYVYLFWLDFPLKGFRTTFLAGFWIVTAVPVQLGMQKVVDIGVKEVIVLIALQILFTALHFVSSIFLYTPKFNFRARPD